MLPLVIDLVEDRRYRRAAKICRKILVGQCYKGHALWFLLCTCSTSGKCSLIRRTQWAPGENSEICGGQISGFRPFLQMSLNEFIGENRVPLIRTPCAPR